MEIKQGKNKPHFTRGESITLSGNEIAVAIESYLVAHNICIRGPRTIKINGELIEEGYIYVDPSGYIIDNSEVST